MHNQFKVTTSNAFCPILSIVTMPKHRSLTFRTVLFAHIFGAAMQRPNDTDNWAHCVHKLQNNHLFGRVKCAPFTCTQIIYLHAPRFLSLLVSLRMQTLSYLHRFHGWNDWQPGSLRTRWIKSRRPTKKKSLLFKCKRDEREPMIAVCDKIVWPSLADGMNMKAYALFLANFSYLFFHFRMIRAIQVLDAHICRQPKIDYKLKTVSHSVRCEQVSAAITFLHSFCCWYFLSFRFHLISSEFCGSGENPGHATNTRSSFFSQFFHFRMSARLDGDGTIKF